MKGEKTILGLKYYSLSRASKLMGMTYLTLYKKVRNMEVGFVRFSNKGSYYISEAYLKDYLEQSIHKKEVI